MRKSGFSNILETWGDLENGVFGDSSENPSEIKGNPEELAKIWDFPKEAKSSVLKKSINPPKKEEKSSLIHLTKTNLKTMLKEIQLEVEKETKIEKKAIKPRDSIDELILETSKKKGEKTRQLVLSKEEMKGLFQAYEVRIKEKLMTKEDRYLKNWIDYYESMKDYCEKYYKLQNLLWYYYSYQPEIYHKLMNEYYMRTNEKTLNQLGLNQQLSNLGYKASYENLEKYIPKELMELDIVGPKFSGPTLIKEKKPSFKPDFINKKEG